MFALSFPQPDVAVLTLDDPSKGVNILSRESLNDLERHLDRLAAQKELSGLILRSTKAGNFIAGADVREFVTDIALPPEQVSELARRGQKLFGRLAQLPMVTIAAIHGGCLGGGLELAVWCDRRIVTDSPLTSLAFPEVKLGIFPGWGGTARTPRLIGLSNAIELVTGGEPIDGPTAYRMGLAQELIRLGGRDDLAADALLESALAMAATERVSRQYEADRACWRAPIGLSETELGFLGATASAYIQGQTKGHYPAPMAALELMLGAAGVDVDQACEMEASAFPQLFGSPENRALLNVFFLRDQNKKSATAGETIGREVRRASVVGAGVMGQGIAAACAKQGVQVTLGDQNVEAAARGVQGALAEASFDKKLQGPAASRALELAPLLTLGVNDAQIASADIVIEAIYEDAAAKCQLYANLEPLMSHEAILATNTSTIPIAALSARLKRPERFCGLHFFNPVRRMPLVEVIRGPHTESSCVAAAVAFARRIGKSPIVVNDGPGFLVNRVLFPYMNEALLLAEEGIPLQSIDRAATQFGMPMGPISLFDTVGLDVAMNASKVLAAAFPDRVIQSPLVAALVAQGRLGQKSGGGFFDYGAKNRNSGSASPVVAELLASRASSPRKVSNEEITQRLMLPMLLEATRVLEDGIAQSVQDVDLALIYGIGFPPFRGGLFFWADAVGAGKIVQQLAQFSELGPRFQSTRTLSELAKTGGAFYAKPVARKDLP